MARDIVLDTGVIVGLQRGQLQPADAYQPDDQLAISVVTATELLVGPELAASHLAAQLRHAAEASLNSLYVLDYDLRVARVHALLIAHARRAGEPRGAFDLAIAATAVAHRRVLVTTDARASFADLPGLDVKVVGRQSS